MTIDMCAVCVAYVWPFIPVENHYRYMRTQYLDDNGGHEGPPEYQDLTRNIIVVNNYKTFPMHAITTINNTRLCQMHAAGRLS